MLQSIHSGSEALPTGAFLVPEHRSGSPAIATCNDSQNMHRRGWFNSLGHEKRSCTSCPLKLLDLQCTQPWPFALHFPTTHARSSQFPSPHLLYCLQSNFAMDGNALRCCVHKRLWCKIRCSEDVGCLQIWKCWNLGFMHQADCTPNSWSLPQVR